MTESLPIESSLPELLSAIRASRPVILRAPPGAGKTTRVPAAILESGVIDAGKVLLLQPRRMAARAAARRLARLAGESVGETYGYHVRFDRRVSAATRVISMTNGVLLRQLTSDPLLEEVGCVILDEFHERSIEIDLILGMLQRVRTTLRPELQLIVMSATIDTEPLAATLEDAQVIESAGRQFDVEIRYDSAFRQDRIEDRIAEPLSLALDESPGNVLVFLPGVGEIHRTAERVGDVVDRSSAELFKLYGDLSPDDQDRVLSPDGTRRVVLATNIAETSVTIPGVTAVIDSGLAKIQHYDQSVGLPALKTQPISKASADQRSGRAGRTAPGICYRLWPAAMQRGRPEQTPPEIHRADLSTCLLTLAAWGERDVYDFPWTTVPRKDAVEQATRLLSYLGAIDSNGVITEMGHAIVSLPVHPRLARLMLAARDNKCLEDASLAAALLSERSPFVPGESSAGMASHITIESDLIDRVECLKRHFSGHRVSSLRIGSAKNIKRVAEQLRRLVVAPDDADDGKWSSEESFSRCLLAAYPDRLAKRRRPDSSSAIMVGGRGVCVDPSSSVRSSELFLCIDVDGKGVESKVRMASGVDPTWLPSEGIEVKKEIFFHRTLESVVARSRTYFHDVMLSESPAECEPNEDTAELLLSQVADDPCQLLPQSDASLQSFLARLQFLSRRAPELGLPECSREVILELARMFCARCTSLKQLAGSPWEDHLRGMFSFEQLKLLDQHAPERLEVPSGNRLRLEYSDDKPPVLAVRIQEIFGWQSTPRLAAGRVPVQLHLLAPNHRPQQITDDLESFWQTTYHEVRKELKRRYAKHHWPDDPARATATRNGLKPK